MAKLGLNFRATSGYVTDPSGTTYALPDGAANYPTTRGGLTFGTLVNFQFEGRDRDSGLDARLAGVMFSGASGQQYRIDLPDGAGDYDIWCAIGEPAGSVTCGMLIKDGAGSTLATISGAVSPTNFIDATNTTLSAANWPGSNASTRLTFTASYMILESDASSHGIRLAHIALEKVTGGSSSVPPIYHYRAQL